MKPGDLVSFRLDSNYGIILRYIPFEERGCDPFPHFEVLFSYGGILSCRESDLVAV